MYKKKGSIVLLFVSHLKYIFSEQSQNNLDNIKLFILIIIFY